MKFHFSQKIGLAGIGFIALIGLGLLIAGKFTPFVLIGTFPFCVLLLIGYYYNSKRNRNQG